MEGKPILIILLNIYECYILCFLNRKNGHIFSKLRIYGEVLNIII